jgi:uncharacterized membrane-anchored protein
MGDFFAQNLGLGHAKGLPFLAIAFLLIILLERFDRLPHEFWYWAAIVVVRTAATNLGDLLCGDFRLPRLAVSIALALGLSGAVALAWNAWRRAGNAGSGRKRLLLGGSANYWLCMLIAGTLGTVMGDYVAHDRHLGNALASIALGLMLAGFFAMGRQGRMLLPALYWSTVVMVRAAGTTVGDFLAQRDIMGLALSTAVTGAAFVLLLAIQWGRRSRFTQSGND